MADKSKTFSVPEESHAREFLANERTFLAWIRTSIAVIGFGFAVIKFDVWIKQISSSGGSAGARQSGMPLSIGGLMVVIGGILAAFGAWHYRITNRQITSGEVKANNLLILAASGLVVLLSIVIVTYLIFNSDSF